MILRSLKDKWQRKATRQDALVYESLKAAVRHTAHDAKTPLVTVKTGICYVQQTLANLKQVQDDDQHRQAYCCHEDIEYSQRLLNNALVEVDQLANSLEDLRRQIED